eukprot:3461999-Pyramimonas_sp.AAC.1
MEAPDTTNLKSPKQAMLHEVHATIDAWMLDNGIDRHPLPKTLRPCSDVKLLDIRTQLSRTSLALQ